MNAIGDWGSSTGSWFSRTDGSLFASRSVGFVRSALQYSNSALKNSHKRFKHWRKEARVVCLVLQLLLRVFCGRYKTLRPPCLEKSVVQLQDLVQTEGGDAPW